MKENELPHLIQCRDRLLDYSNSPLIVGILNVTPDSFSDGGRYMCQDAAVGRALQMMEGGATIIDIGGASSRPRGKAYGRGAEALPPEEELRRILPIIRVIVRKYPQSVLSVDTYHPVVAREVLEAGAHMINDITGLRYFPEMAEVVASYDAALIVMDSPGLPGEMAHEQGYADVISEVCASLETSVTVARSAGIRDIVVDPGFGFGKTVKQNLQLISELEKIVALGCPVMVGISRKSTIGSVLGEGDNPAPIHDRLYGTLGATAVAIMRGAALIRTHYVRPTAQLAKLVHATKG